MKIALRLLLLIIVLAALPALVFFNMEKKPDVARAKAVYERTAEELTRVTARLNETEHRLTLLTTSLEGVEDEVRRTHRMIKPGETMMLVINGESAPGHIETASRFE